MVKRSVRRFLAMVLALVMILGLGITGANAAETDGGSKGVEWEKLDPSEVGATLFGQSGAIEKNENKLYEDTDTVRVLIVMDEDAKASSGEIAAVRNDALFQKYSETMTVDQAVTAARISKDALGGRELDVVWSFDVVTDAISANVEYGKIEEIAGIEGVKSVLIERRYEMLDEADNITSQQMTGADGVKSGAAGRYGAGTSVAVIDTGLTVDHISFSAEGLEYALRENAEKAGKDYDEYLAGLDMITKDVIAENLTKLHAYERDNTLTADKLYRNIKVPFAFNYSTGTTDVSHDSGGDGNEHGSHVAGIAAANRYLPASKVFDMDGDGDFDVADAQKVLDMAVKGEKVENPVYTDLNNDGEVTAYDAYLLLIRTREGDVEEYVPASESVRVDGVAPDAQIVAMNVFTDGSTYSSDYIAALEDAITLGVDVSNLSLGSPQPGYSESHMEYGRGAQPDENGNVPLIDEWIDGVFAQAVKDGMVVSISAGNSGNWADEDDAYNLMYADEGGVGNLGAPGSFADAFTVASADNTGYTANESTVAFNAAGVQVALRPSDMSGTPKPWGQMDPDGLGSEYEYVFLGDPTNLYKGETQTDMSIYAGEASDFEKADFNGKIAVVTRGNMVNFITKHENAEKAGAIAVIVVNNEPGDISGTVAGDDATPGTTAKIPIVGISIENGLALLLNSDKDGDGAFCGKIKVMSRAHLVDAEGEAKMSYFSSWGTTGDLKIKPEITAPGGAIMSVNGADGNTTAYELMSGTSMSSPHNAGLAALGVDYVTGNDGEVLKKAQALQPNITAGELVQSLLMSTAVPLVEHDGIEYSVRNQGAGLANIQNAVNAKSFITVEDADKGKVKAEMGDGTGPFTFTFSINNITAEPLTYDLSQSILTTGVTTVEGHQLTTDEMVELGASVTYTGAEDGKVTVPAGSTVKVTVAITVPEAVAEDMRSKGFTNGFYVEGYIYLTGSDVTHSIPLLGWYGSWLAPSMYDVNSITDLFYGTETRPSHINDRAKNELTYAPIGYDQGYDYSGNIYNISASEGLSDAEYIEERNAFNDEDPKWEFFAVFPTLIRSAKDFDLFITGVTEDGKADLGKIYYEDERYINYERALFASFYYTSAGQWYDVTSDYGIGIDWDMTDPATGEKLPEGAKIMISFVAVPEYGVDDPDYAREEETGKRSTDLKEYIDNPGTTLSWTFTVDNTAPQVVEKGDETFKLSQDNVLTMDVKDNRYVAAVVVMDGAASSVVEYKYPDMTAEGETKTVEVDLTSYREQYGDKVVIAVCDYAGNETYYGLNLNGEGNPYGEFVGFQFDGFGGSKWISFDKNVNRDETSLFNCEGVSFTAAEYVNGMVFAQAEDGKLYGIAYEDMLNNNTDLETSYITTLENVYTDLAYNYMDGKLYGIHIYEDSRQTATEVFSISPLVSEGWETPFTEEPTGIYNGNVYGLTLAIDDDGVMYVIGSKVDVMGDEPVESETAYLFKCEPEENYGYVGYNGLTEVGDTKLTFNYLQSMTWDHNDETLYWARFVPEGMITTVAELYKVDTSSGNCERTGILTEETAGLMAPLTEDAAGNLTHENVPMFDRDVVARPVLSTHNLALNLGGTDVLTCTFDPWFSTHKDVEWSSDDDSVVSVDQNGVVTGVSTGSATITVTSTEADEWGDRPSDSCTVTVASISLSIEGYTSFTSGGVNNVSDSMMYTFELDESKPTVTIGDRLAYTGEGSYGLKIASSEKAGDKVWASEWGNTGVIYDFDAVSGKTANWYQPIDGDMMFALTYSDTTKMFTGAMNSCLYLDLPLPLSDEDLEAMDRSYDEDKHEHTWHRVYISDFMDAALGNLVTQEGDNGNMSAITISGMTSMPGAHHFVDSSYLGGSSSPAIMGDYTADTTLVLLDNVGRLWYIDEITGMTYGEDAYGEMGYTRDDGSFLTLNSYSYGGVDENYFTLEYENEGGESTYSVFVIREIVETPLLDMFQEGELGLSYYFSDIYYVGQFGAVDEKAETGDCPMFVFSLYDYWNEGSENEFYLYVQNRVGTYDSSWQRIFTKGLLYDLGNLGKGYVVSTINSVRYEGGLEETSIPVTFHPGEGVEGEDYVQYFSAENFELPTDEYFPMEFGWSVPDNMAFDYWADSNGDPVEGYPELTRGLEFTAHWTEKTGVTYEPGNPAVGDSVTVYYGGSTFDLPSEWDIEYDPFWWSIPDGMEFAGWADERGELVTETYGLELVEGLTFTAKWNKLTEVKFNPGEEGENLNYATGSLYFGGDTFELPTQYGLYELGWRSLPRNYKLTGWKNDVTGEIKGPGEVVDLAEGLSFTAQWEVSELSSDTGIESIYYNYTVTEPEWSSTRYEAVDGGNGAWTLELPMGVPMPETYRIIVETTDLYADAEVSGPDGQVYTITVTAENGDTAQYTLTVVYTGE